MRGPPIFAPQIDGDDDGLGSYCTATSAEMLQEQQLRLKMLLHCAVHVHTVSRQAGHLKKLELLTMTEVLVFRVKDGPAVADLHVTASKSFWQVQAATILHSLV